MSDEKWGQNISSEIPPEEKYAIVKNAKEFALEGAMSLSADVANELGTEKVAAAMEEYASGVVGSTNAVQNRYPSPLLSLSDFSIPNSYIDIFKWSRYNYMFDPLINGAVDALSVYPVTELTFEDIEDEKQKSEKDMVQKNNTAMDAEDQQDIGNLQTEESDTLRTYRKVILEKLHIVNTLIEIGIDYNVYGNCFVFGEMELGALSGKAEWKRVVRLNPLKMHIDYNASTGEKLYKWEVPDNIKAIVKNKKPIEEYNKIPELFKQAVKENKTVTLNPDNIYHLARPSDSASSETAWGVPILANVMKLVMYRNVLRQAQEAIAREHIVPFRIFYLNPSTDGTMNPQGEWNNVKTALAQELMKQVRDPNHKVVSPCPVGMVEAGGNGRALMLTSEIEQVQSEILAGMNVPREFIFGGAGWQSSSIALRILENKFTSYRLILLDFIQNFLIKGMAKARGEWINEADDDKLIKVRFSDLKMMDDTQKKSILISLNQNGKISDEHLMKEFGIDPDKMRQACQDEQLANTKNQLALKEAEYKAQLDFQVYQAELLEQYKKKYPKVFAEEMQPQPVEEAGPMSAQPLDQAQEAQEGPQEAQEGQGAAQVGNVPAETPDTSSSAPQTKRRATPKKKSKPEPQAQQGDDVQLSPAELNIAQNIMKLPPNQQVQILEKLSRKNAEVAARIMTFIKSQQDSHGADMRPLPEQREPRRKSLQG